MKTFKKLSAIMKTFKKLSAIAIISFSVLMSSCDPGYDDTYKVRNGLDRDIKLTQGRVYGTNEKVRLEHLTTN